MKIVDIARDEATEMIIGKTLGSHCDFQLSSTLWRSQFSMSDCNQPTARAPSDIGFGKLPWETRRYMLLRDRPILAITAGSLSTLLFIFKPLRAVKDAPEAH